MFNLSVLMTYEQVEKGYLPEDSLDGSETWKVLYDLVNGLNRYDLYRLHKWPPSGEIFALATITYNRLEGVEP